MRALPLLLAIALASCGGGTTAGPVAATTDAASQPAPAAATAPAAAQPAPAASADATATAPRRAPRPSARPSGGAASPSPSAPAASADPPASDPGGDAAATTPDPPAPAAPQRDPEPAGSPIDERADLTLVNRVSPAHYFQQGTVTGTYDGTMEVEARITSRGVLVRFTATLAGGEIAGRGVAVAILDSTTWPSLRGTAIVTGGTGRFAGIRGRRLKVTGRAKPDASRAHVRLAGTVTY